MYDNQMNYVCMEDNDVHQEIMHWKKYIGAVGRNDGR